MEAILPHLFRTEYQKLVAVLTRHFGFENLQLAEDIASDTFLAATELWVHKGVPDQPVAWLYTVARNKARDLLRRDALFARKIRERLAAGSAGTEELPEPDLSQEAIADSQLQMMFAVCHPSIPPEAQVGIALRVLCGFGIDEIAAAFLTSKDTINKRLHRAREKLRAERIELVMPGPGAVDGRLDIVLATLYILFNEGYYAYGRDTTMRRELCLEAMRLTLLLTGNKQTAQPKCFALLALMCFAASRFDARLTEQGEGVVYEEQDTTLWNSELVERGNAYLHLATQGPGFSRYHLEASIAWWHTGSKDKPDKWKHILRLYDQLLRLEYTPMAALNRIYALYQVEGAAPAIAEAEKLGMTGNHLYHALLGELYTGIDNSAAVMHLEEAIRRTPSAADKRVLDGKLRRVCRRTYFPPI